MHVIISRISNRRKNEERFFTFLFIYFRTIGMKKIVKQVVGIDVAQKELVISLGRIYDDLTPELYANKNFANTPTGIGKLINWVNKQMDPGVEVRYVMEATGVY